MPPRERERERERDRAIERGRGRSGDLSAIAADPRFHEWERGDSQRKAWGPVVNGTQESQELNPTSSHTSLRRGLHISLLLCCTGHLDCRMERMKSNYRKAAMETRQQHIQGGISEGMYNERDRVGLSRSRAIEKIALFYVAVLAGLLHRFPANFTQQTAGQIRNRESGGSAGAKASEQGEAITFADVAGVDEAKAELEEIVEFLRNPDSIYDLVHVLHVGFSW
ncbi:hypothetical protein TB2_038474 [Malus domestica]